MDAEARARAMDLLGRFNDDLTRAVDAVFGTRWAEIEEMVALIALARDGVITTRDMAEISALGRRAVSRLILRLKDAGLVDTRPSPHDGRAVEVVLADNGRERAEDLRSRAVGLLQGSRELALELGTLLRVDDAEVPPPVVDPLALLLDAGISGAKLVGYMPVAATRGRMAARQRAALVYVATVGEVRPGALAEPLEVSHAGVAYLVDQLCTKGFLRRHRDEVVGDKRAVVLRVTPEGMDAVASVARGITQERVDLSRLFQQIAAWRPAAAVRRSREVDATP
jgi:DNA-binding MarR family transcriptional regulator